MTERCDETESDPWTPLNALKRAVPENKPTRNDRMSTFLHTLTDAMEEGPEPQVPWPSHARRTTPDRGLPVRVEVGIPAECLSVLMLSN